jgi:hypothetical protein
LGVPISIGADGITVANTLIPIPGAGSLRDLLLSAGLRVQVLAGESTDTSVTSPALVITTSFVSFLEKPGTATVMVGRASALLDLVTPPAATTTSVAAPGAGPGPSLSPSFDTACCPSAAASNLGSTGSPLAPARTVAASVSGPPIQWQLRNIYLAFVIAALALTAGNAALRHLGVRT